MIHHALAKVSYNRSGVRSAAGLLCAVVLAVAGTARGDNVGGDWLSPPDNNWPVIAIHAALTPDGRVLTYGTRQSGQQTAYFVYDVWDPQQGLTGGHITLDNLTQTDIFCSSQIILPQSGSILIAGGDNWTGTGTTNTGNNNTNIFSPSGSTLSRGNNMNRARWYSSSTALMNGEIYIQGGSGGQDRPEVRQLDGTFRLLTNVDTSSLQSLYPRNFLAPDGRVFGYDTNGNMYFVNPDATGQIQRVGQFSSAYAGWTSGAAMFRPGRILQMGGNSSGAVVIDINGPQPVVTPTATMSSKRMWVSATTLADGRVVATGGSGVENQLNDVNNSAEIWDPSTGQWTVGPSGLRARLYHSSAVLLPDATVLVAGGGAPGPLVNLHAEIYYPPYLYDSNGNFATRPSIASAPDALDVGQSFSLTVNPGATIRRVTLVKTGSVTHSVNMDQRFVELPFTASSGTLFVDMPTRATDTPPGYYLLFVIDDRGVPSVAKIVRMNIAANPVIQLDYTPTIGGSGGSPFTLSCNSNETLVGVYGNSAGTYVNRVGAMCVAVDQGGRWIGTPVQRGASGGASGAAYTRLCPTNFAISGFRGRSAQYVDQLDFECRALTPAGGLTGTGQYLGAVGGAGGSPQGPFSCSTANPVYALTGRSGSWIDAFGMLCRQAPITNTQTNTPPILTNPGNQVGSVGSPVTLSVSATDPDMDPLTFDASGLPAGLSISAAGVISGIPSAAGTHAVTVTVSDGEASATASFTWTIADVDPLVLDPMPVTAPALAGTPVTYTATARNGVNTRYRWQFGDGTETAWSASPTVTHAFAAPTLYWVTVMARDDRGTELSQTFSQIVHLPLTAGRPSSSTSIALAGGRLWVVNPDADTVSVFDSASRQKLAETAVGTAPRAVAVSPANQLWVTSQRSDSITVLDNSTLSVAGTVSLPYGSAPYGIAIAQGGSPYVVLEGSGRVVRLDPATGAIQAGVDVGPGVRHISIAADGSRLYVSRFVTPPLPGEDTENVATTVDGTPVGGQVLVLDAATLGQLGTIVLRHSDDMDFENAGAGVPNYLGAPAISPDGTSAWVPSKKDNVRRGTLRSGGNLNHQNTVRAIASRIDMAGSVETYGKRVDFDNASLASAVAFDPTGVFIFAALETSREVAVVDAHNGEELFRFAVGRAPQGLVVSDDGRRLYVSNFMDRSVGVYDLSRLMEEGLFQAPSLATLPSAAVEKLSPAVLAGKQLFYDARDARLAREGYMSCASCHNDGGGDGRVWDLTGMGEGLRNTISLRGHAGMAQGFLHWSGNFDEVQDFESQIRRLAGGTGLMSDSDFNAGTRSEPLGEPKAGLSADLDALAAYVASLDDFDASPFRNADGTLTAQGAAGRTVFAELNCQQCHGGEAFSSSGAATLLDVGTIKSPTSGSRLGGPLTGLDPPTLRGVWATGPYLHDGSAKSLADAVQAHAGVAVGDAKLADLVAYLNQIDGSEPGVPPLPPSNAAPMLTNPGEQLTALGDSVSLPIDASDADGDPLVFAASGLPTGLAIGSTDGVVRGTALQQGTFPVTIEVSDSKETTRISFGWTVADLTAPDIMITTPTSETRYDSGTATVSIGGSASDNVGVTEVTWSSDRGGNGTASGTGSWVATGIELQNGQNTITVTARDAAGNTGTAVLTVSFKAGGKKRR